MKRSTDRILTTHTGSLPRPDDLIEMMRDKENHRPYDGAAFSERVRAAVLDTVRRQCEIGIDIPSDGEQSKSGFGSYQVERFAGFEPLDPQPSPGRQGFASRERTTFAEYYSEYFKRAMMGATLAPPVTLVCTGPVRYVGHAAVQQDIDNLKAGGWQDHRARHAESWAQLGRAPGAHRRIHV